MSHNHQRVDQRRRGSIAILSALMIVVMLGMMAFAIDIGYMGDIRTDLQRSVDSAAFAGAGALVDGTTAAQTEAIRYLGYNPVGTRTLTASNATVEFGLWDPVARSFSSTPGTPNAIRLTASDNARPLFFGKVFGKSTFDSTAKAIATYQPRDIALVLDYSSSMCYDSQFRNISLLGQPAIEANLQQIYTELGSPTFGSLTFAPVAYGTTSTSTTTVKNHFGLGAVAYPYPGGSWSEYISYVQTDSYINSAGYRCKYGYLTWVNYLLAKRNSNNDGPALKNTSEQPVTALKDAVDEFISYLQSHQTDDQISLSIYTYSDGTAVLESVLTKNLTSIANICRARQAGHYTNGTNISAGMTKGRAELQAHARTGAFKMMVLMTDGVVNLPTGSSATDKQKVIDEANLCASAHIPIVTISVGALADTALMQQVADITGGAAFVVPGGQPIANVKSQLEQVFAQVAKDRPLKLVQ